MFDIDATKTWLYGPKDPNLDATTLAGIRSAAKWVAGANKPTAGVWLAETSVFNSGGLLVALTVRNSVREAAGGPEPTGYIIGLKLTFLKKTADRQYAKQDEDAGRIAFELSGTPLVEFLDFLLGKRVQWSNRVLREGSAPKDIEAAVGERAEVALRARRGTTEVVVALDRGAVVDILSMGAAAIELRSPVSGAMALLDRSAASSRASVGQVSGFVPEAESAVNPLHEGGVPRSIGEHSRVEIMRIGQELWPAGCARTAGFMVGTMSEDAALLAIKEAQDGYFPRFEFAQNFLKEKKL